MQHFQFSPLRIGLFEMKESGLIPIKDPSQAFIETSQETAPGSVILPYTQGNRVILLEIQVDSPPLKKKHNQ